MPIIFRTVHLLRYANTSSFTVPNAKSVMVLSVFNCSLSVFSVSLFVAENRFCHDFTKEKGYKIAIPGFHWEFRF